MSKHQWVKIVITPVHVIDDPEVSSEPVVLITEEDEAEALECAQFGCIRCDETLTSETLNEDCEVESETLWTNRSTEEDRP
jgi:hypothetical protein